MELTITQPDDWHLHLRDGDVLEAVVPHSASHFGRGIVIPNLKPSVTITTAALNYHESILKVVPPSSSFALITIYLTDTRRPEEIKRARKNGVVFVVKLYPVTDLFGKCFPDLEEMVEQNMSLLVGSMGERQRENRRTTKGKVEKRRKTDEQLKFEKGERQNLNDKVQRLISHSGFSALMPPPSSNDDFTDRNKTLGSDPSVHDVR